ncbi:HEAT repeat domain-containing protein [Epilithonimonas hungarica]|uniref:HEAT repeat-containing protein n=1 Tax=Epilithonimonas hungarica TaxID=454006 RepID=A0A1G7UBG6_9FLAO|nr:HEAT repeat domain-containing protein [Epilithonimonas hungarica]SDG44922.1 HEAT repeat-containing protein [Epilithonimonas hungarica]
MKDSLKKYINDHRDEFDNLEVPDEMFDKIMSKLDSSTPSVSKTRPLFPLKTWAIAASVTIILSFGIFNLWSEKEIDKTVIATKQTPKKEDENLVETLIPKKESETETKIRKNNAKVLANNSSDSPKQSIGNQNFVPNYNTEDEDHSDKANAIELMNNEFSASSRLQGIALVKSFSEYDSKIIDFLSEKAISDENTNVRLAAVSALEIQKQNPAITNRIQQIFIQQNDPMVQKELISFLAEKQTSELSAEVNTKLLALAQDPTTVAFVKDEAYAVLMKY